MGVSMKWPEGTAKLREFLLPEEGGVQAAFGEFVEEVHEGASVQDALTAFCRQIIANGKTD